MKKVIICSIIHHACLYITIKVFSKIYLHTPVTRGMKYIYNSFPKVLWFNILMQRRPHLTEVK